MGSRHPGEGVRVPSTPGVPEAHADLVVTQSQSHGREERLRKDAELIS